MCIRDRLAREDIDLITVCAPNDVHHRITIDAARAGKHVICEKPLAVTLAEADEMIAACRQAGVKLMYAEELCFAPKYVRAKQLADEGALGRITLVKQSEKHDGPHAPWFWDMSRVGGGVTFDMGCHASEFVRWVLDKPEIAAAVAGALPGAYAIASPQGKDANDWLREGLLGGLLSTARRRACKGEFQRERLLWDLWDAANGVQGIDQGTAQVVERLAGEALRTLAVAYLPLDGDAPHPVSEAVENGLIFAGIVGIIDPPRAEARVAIAEANRAGVRVVMITGDHPATAARIAADLGLAPAGAPTITGLQIEQLADDAFRRSVREASVFARVAPEHKLRIVEALQADGNIVCMTGDGVNDAPALKRADIGVAMGVTGTDVTKEAAKMILVDDNFATIVAAVREGRGIFANIRKFLRYLLSSNAGEVLTMLLGVVAAGVIGLDEAGGTLAVPLLATQILWINLLTDTGPALAMGVDPETDDVMALSLIHISEPTRPY